MSPYHGQMECFNRFVIHRVLSRQTYDDSFPALVAYFRGHVAAARYPSEKLIQPLPTKDGSVLRTIGATADYVLALPHEQSEFCRTAGAMPPRLYQADVAGGEPAGYQAASRSVF